MAKNTLTITDNRTGKQYEIPIEEGGAIRAALLRDIKTGPEDFGLMSYDPAFTNTASCRSKITFIDGDKGILRYRGYPIEELAEKQQLPRGRLPDGQGRTARTSSITAPGKRTSRPTRWCMRTSRSSCRVSATTRIRWGCWWGRSARCRRSIPTPRRSSNLESRRLQTRRLIGKLPTLAAWAYRHTRGLPYVYPDNELSYTGNFLSMLFKMTELRYKPNPTLERALDILFILHADHEQNCSTNAMRSVGSSQVDPYSAVAAATAALYGPLHGGANEAVIRMLMEIGSVKNVPEFIKSVKAGERKTDGLRPSRVQELRPARQDREAARLRGLRGHRPQSAHRYLAGVGEDRAGGRVLRLASSLYPNVDFYTGIIYQAMGFPMTMFPVLFAIPRTSGWMAQWAEMVRDPEQKIARPRQIYIGEKMRHWTPIEKRPAPTTREDAVSDQI